MLVYLLNQSMNRAYIMDQRNDGLEHNLQLAKESRLEPPFTVRIIRNLLVSLDQ
jgi:hypothetical protein